MRVVIAGSRDITDYNVVRDAVAASGFTVTEVVSGGARGVDTLGKQWAENNALSCTEMLAFWDKEGKAAGYKRNVRMADYADALVAIWDGKSKGTKHMIDIANSKGLPVFVWEK